MRFIFAITLACLGFLVASPPSAFAQGADASAGPGACVIPSATRVIVRTAVQIDTDMAAGQQIAVRLAEDLPADGTVCLEAGARGLAEVIDVRDSDVDDGELRIAFRLVSLRVEGYSVPVLSGQAGLSASGGAVRQTGPGEVVAGSRGGIELRDDGRRLVIRSGTEAVFQLSESVALPGR